MGFFSKFKFTLGRFPLTKFPVYLHVENCSLMSYSTGIPPLWMKLLKYIPFPSLWMSVSQMSSFKWEAAVFVRSCLPNYVICILCRESYTPGLIDLAKSFVHVQQILLLIGSLSPSYYFTLPWVKFWQTCGTQTWLVQWRWFPLFQKDNAENVF